MNIFSEYQKTFCLWLEKMSLTCQPNLKLHKKMGVDAEKWCAGNNTLVLYKTVSDEIPGMHVDLLLLYVCLERALGRTNHFCRLIHFIIFMDGIRLAVIIGTA